MTDKPTDATDKPKKEDEILEPEEVVSDAAETAFMENEVENEKFKK